ncbi:bacterioferritin [Pseudovibrio japonicus]|uniref:Bacterioferritin n=1 Tax=Pseudovibrio japonicus TaxID=366534 RepID=A0ABQ3EWL8_9HYPH|nr:bacterioferritin [Pseudovibrio japonicus]GHB48758.1 bacterioferritin [Pseudovibrio japonicus]
MKAKDGIIERLNKAISMELGAVNQYWVHFRLLEDWGYTKLAKKERAESIEEMHHADRLVERVVFLEGHPNLQQIAPLRVGSTVKEVLEADLAGEREAIEYYSESRVFCEQKGDFVTMALFDALLADEEGHCDYLETQLELLESIGEEKYGLLNAGSADEAD